MQYTFSYEKPHQQYLNISLILDAKEEDALHFQLPAWRPGRYELSNFAKNIRSIEARDEKGNLLSVQKKAKDLWKVSCKKSKRVEVTYTYYANELDAGSTYLDEDQLYINPVNCLLYEVDRLEKRHELQLELPADYLIATSLQAKGKHHFQAKDYHELADAPLICSANLQMESYRIEETEFFLCFQGIFKPDWDLLKKHFYAFTKEQMKFFGGFPTKQYHFLFQILTKSKYHGVEHAASTVIVLGPAYSLLKKEGRYEDLLGVSSHELFHTWNVKRIRPQEMWPYDYTKENYTKLGYLTEGATTWYGDLMLYRSGVFDDEAFFRTFNQLLNRHFNNPGVLNLSVAESSFDTWLDGYVPGIPNRKASIYTEGALITFFLDVEIRKATANKKSFDQVLQLFYKEFYLKGKGISEENYRETVEEVAAKKMGFIFDHFIYGAKDFSKQLKESLDYFGLEMSRKPTAFFHESYLGLRLLEEKVFSVFPDSPADRAGFSIGDKPLHINGIEIEENLSEWLAYFVGEEVRLGVMRKDASYLELTLKPSQSQLYYANYEVSRLKKPNPEQKTAFKVWKASSQMNA